MGDKLHRGAVSQVTNLCATEQGLPSGPGPSVCQPPLTKIPQAHLAPSRVAPGLGATFLPQRAEPT